jgi:hypothetical protein
MIMIETYNIKHETYNERGSVLAYALVIMAAVLIILVSMLGYIVSQIKFSANRVEKEKAFQVAEAGVYFYRWYVAHETYNKDPKGINSFWQSGTALGIASPYEADYEGLGKYKIEVEQPAPGSTIAVVKSTGWTYKLPGTKRVVRVRLRRPSWSEYAALANDFMRFGEGTEIYGKVHSNKGIRMDGHAHNLVTSLLSNTDDPDHCEGNWYWVNNGCKDVRVCDHNHNEFGVHTHVNTPPGSGINDDFRPLEAPPTSPVPARTDIFMAGRQFSVPEVSFSGATLILDDMRTEAQKPGGTTLNNCTAAGCYFDSSYPRRITLKSNGTMDVCRVSVYDSSSTTDGCYAYGTYSISRYRKNDNSGNCSSCSGDCAPATYTIPGNGIIFVDNNVWIEGTVSNKKITIAAANSSSTGDIYVGINNLRYTNYDGRDIIGLVAQRNISIVGNSQNYLTVDAALLAQAGRVGRDYYSHAYDKNTITVNGSIATFFRYGFAYTDGSGYDTRVLNFDNNLLYYPPPYFPTGTDYSIDLWEEL